MRTGLFVLLLALVPTAAAGVDDRTRERIVAAAMDQLGTPYRFGGTGPDAFDCSGLAQWSYRMAGVELPRTTVSQRQTGIRVPLAKARPGDLLFYRYASGGAKPSGLHVVIYLGDERAIHAPSSGGRVEVIDIGEPHWRQRFIEARRPLGKNATMVRPATSWAQRTAPAGAVIS